MSGNGITRVSARLPEALHVRLRQAAERDRRSLHAQLLHYIERGLDQDDSREQEERRSR